MNGEIMVSTTERLKDLNVALVANEKLQAAIQRVIDRGGRGSAEAARYDRQHHRHNKS